MPEDTQDMPVTMERKSVVGIPGRGGSGFQETGVWVPNYPVMSALDSELWGRDQTACSNDV